MVDWRKAACKVADPEVFFPEKGGDHRPAKAICRRCDIKEPCLEYALEANEHFGVWGGLSARERREVRRSAA